MGGSASSQTVEGDHCSKAPLRVKTNESLPEIALDKISNADVSQWTQKVMDLYKVPICFLALEAPEGMYLKGRHGMQTPFARFPCICRHEKRRELPIIVCDTRQHPQYRFDPFVDGPPYARFYVGAPVMLPGSRCIGTVCLMDPKPRDDFSLQQCEYVVECGKHIAAHVAMRIQGLLCMTSDSLASLSPHQSSVDSLDALAVGHNINKACTKDSLTSIEEEEKESIDGDGHSTVWLSERAPDAVEAPSNSGQVPEELQWSSSEPPNHHT